MLVDLRWTYGRSMTPSSEDRTESLLEWAPRLRFAPDWVHLRKLDGLLGLGDYPVPGSSLYPVHLASFRDDRANDYVQMLTSKGGFGVFPDTARVGETLIWRDTWIGKRQDDDAGRPGTHLRTTTVGGRACDLWIAHEHCIGTTATNSLWKKKHRVVVGTVTNIDDEEIDVDPALVGQLAAGHDRDPPAMAADDLRLDLRKVDVLSAVDFSKRPLAAQMRAIEKMPESEVKRIFAEIIGETYFPKDWGGERSDLNTARLAVDGRTLEASFVFKGPAAPKRMVIATLGKNGDQVDRALTESPDLLVVQHWGSIDVTVRHMIERYCFHQTYARHKQTLWATVDGATTAQIFRDTGRLHV